MARYNRMNMMKRIDTVFDDAGPYFLAMDITSRLRDRYGENFNDLVVMNVLKQKKRVQTTGMTVRRGGCNFVLFKRHGIENPPEGWAYKDRVEA